MLQRIHDNCKKKVYRIFFFYGFSFCCYFFISDQNLDQFHFMQKANDNAKIFANILVKYQSLSWLLINSGPITYTLIFPIIELGYVDGSRIYEPCVMCIHVSPPISTVSTIASVELAEGGTYNFILDNHGIKTPHWAG